MSEAEIDSHNEYDKKPLSFGVMNKLKSIGKEGDDKTWTTNKDTIKNILGMESKEEWLKYKENLLVK